MRQADSLGRNTNSECIGPQQPAPPPPVEPFPEREGLLTEEELKKQLMNYDQKRTWIKDESKVEKVMASIRAIPDWKSHNYFN